MLNKSGPVNSDSTEVVIGNGVVIPKEIDDFVKLAFQNSPMKFLKNLNQRRYLYFGGTGFPFPKRWKMSPLS